jgi:hypothetical protein
VADREMTEWQIWVTHSLEELLQARLATELLSWESFFANLAAKSFRKLFKLTGMAGVSQWQYNDLTPSLATILKFCYVCNVTPLQVMRNRLIPLERALQSGILPRAAWLSNSPRRLDLEHCKKLLQLALDSPEESFGIAQVAELLGCTRYALRYHFPQECALLTKRTQEFRKRRSKEYTAKVCEEVQKAVYLFHVQGVFPSIRRVANMLSHPGYMRRSDALEALHATRRELGLEQ